MNIVSFWEKQHKKQNILYLSDYPGEDVWDFLQIHDFIIPGNKVLNIGVGTGKCTKDLKAQDMEVFALDISKIALDNVKDVVKASWLSKHVEILPSDYFDLAISHLVTQHMSDGDLLNQLNNVIRSLKKDGVFAMQFATADVPIGYNYESLARQKAGGVCRTPEHMEKLVKQVDGQIIYWCPKVYWRHAKCTWNGIHITKSNKPLITTGAVK